MSAEPDSSGGVVNGRERSDVANDHLVQLFDEPASLADVLARFLFAGWKRGQTLLVVARPEHWAITKPRLDALGCRVRSSISAGDLLVLDADTTLASLMTDGAPDSAKFTDVVGALVSRLDRDSKHGLRVYGEMVDILAEQGDIRAADELEGLWNGLRQQCPLTLLCGYASAHFTDESTTHHLQKICARHDRAAAKSSDLLASWLLADRLSRYHTHQ